MLMGSNIEDILRLDFFVRLAHIASMVDTVTCVRLGLDCHIGWHFSVTIRIRIISATRKDFTNYQSKWGKLKIDKWELVDRLLLI